jgi:phage shock protein A
MTSEDGKPGFFTRMKRAITSTVDDAIESVSDPGQELSLLIDDLGAEIKQAEKDHQQAVVDRKLLERKLAEIQTKEQGWLVRAEQAMKLGDETLARAALQRKVEIGQERATIDQAIVEQTKLAEDMRDHIKQAKAKHKSLSLRRGTLMAQARAAKAGGTSAAGIGMAQSSRLDEIEGKIAQIEAFNEVHAEMNGAEIEEQRIDAELRKLDRQLGPGSALDDELALLKAKIAAGGSKSLTEGKGRG